MSAGGPQYSVLRTISGAIYDGVPQNILIFFSLGMQVEKPKSMILMLLLSSNNRFSSLISLWVIHLEWQYFNPSRIYLKILLASHSSSRRLLFDLRYPCKELPPTYSITKMTYFCVSMISYSYTIVWCFIFSMSFISLLTDFLLFGSSSLYFL